MSRRENKVGLKPGLKAAGPVLSRSEAQTLAQMKNKSVEQVMSKALDQGISLGSALVNSYNRRISNQGAFGLNVPENLGALAGLRLEKGQVYSGSNPVNVNGSTIQVPVIVPRQTISPGYNPQSPGGSTTPLIPGIEIGSSNEFPVAGQVPSAPEFTSEQAQNVENLQQSVRSRAERLEDFKKKIQEAEEQTKKLRADNAASKAAREAQRNQTLADERARSAELEKEFRTRLSNIQSDYSVARENRTNTSQEDRQARMISEFEKASRNIKKNPNYRLGGFKDRFNDFEPIVSKEGASTEGGEDGTPLLTYQELLDRLKQYKRGDF